MFWTRSAVALQKEWQTEIDRSLEAGQTPLLDLGGSPQLLGGLPVLAGLQAFGVQRVDVTMPILVVGGNHALWLALLLQTRSPAILHRSPDPTVVFAGADLVTYLASLTTLMPERTLLLGRMPNAPPPSMTPLFMPYLPARAALPWESLPFAVPEIMQPPTMQTAPLTFGSVNSSVNAEFTTPVDQWTNWVAIAGELAYSCWHY